MLFGSHGRTRFRSPHKCVVLLLICMASASAHGADRLLSQPGATFTLPAPRTPWKLVVYGDTRFTDPADSVNSSPEVRRKLIEKITQEKPAAVLISGDVPLHGADADDYEVFEKETADWRKEGIRVFPALGNHELAGCSVLFQAACLENWWNAFPELRGRRWYSVHMGELYILNLDSNMDLKPGSMQAQWIAEQLQNLPTGVHFVFISVHHPPIADSVVNDTYHNARPNEKALAERVEAVAAQRSDLKFVVVAGHIHNYERFEEGGVEYLIAGGGGATPYQVVRTPKDLYHGSAFPNYHYVKFVFEGERVKATMYRLAENGTFVASDRFELRKGATAASARSKGAVPHSTQRRRR
jgi:calcineurin-like phosphoesterase family protein